MIFFNNHKKKGKKIGQSMNEVLHMAFKSCGISLPDNFYTDEYIYGYINASITNLMTYVFGGKDWSQQKKGECIMEALSTIDPSNALLDFHIDNNFDPVKMQALQNSKNFKLWKKYYSGSSGLMGMKIKSRDKKSIDKFVNSLSLFGHGYSWGGFESLALHQEMKEQGNRKFLNLKKNEYIVRLHIGLEDPADLIKDISKSLKYIK